MQPVPRIFVSATSRDLRTARGLVSEGLRRMECLPIVQDDFPPDYKSVRDMLRTKILTCDAVVHLAGFYYGAEPQPVIPGPDRRSFTQMEYEIAMELKLPCYVFLCGKDFPFDKHDPEPEDKQQLQLDHRARLLQRDELFYEFATPEELSTRTRELQLSVENLRAELAKERGRRRLTLIVAVAAAVIAIGGGIFLLGRQGEQAKVIAATNDQLARQGALIEQLLAEQARLRKAGAGDMQQIAQQAEQNVAQASNQSVEEVRNTVREAIAQAEQAVAAARASQAAGAKGDLATALQRLAEAQMAAGLVNEAITAQAERLALLDRAEDPAGWAAATNALAMAMYDRDVMSTEPRKMLSEAVEWAQGNAALGPKNPATLALMTSLAKVVPAEEGRELNRAVLEVQESELGPDDPATLEARLALARSLLSGEEAEQEESLELFRGVVEANEKKSGPETPETLSSMLDLAYALNTQKKFPQAEEVYRRVLAAREKTLGPDHEETLNPVIMLAFVREDQDDYPGAIDLARRAFTASERAVGPDAPPTLANATILAGLLTRSKSPENLDEAETVTRKVLETRIRTVGAAQPDTLESFESLGDLLEAKGDTEGAKKLVLRRLEEQGKAVGADDTGYALNLFIEASRLFLADDNETARGLAERCLKIREAKLGAGDLKTIEARGLLASIYGALDDRKEAEALQRRNITLLEAEQPEAQAELASANHALALNLWNANRAAEAVAYARTAAEIAAEAMPEDDTKRANIEALLPQLAEVVLEAESFAALREDWKAKSDDGTWQESRRELPEHGGSRDHYALGWLDGKSLMRVMLVDSTGEADGTFTFYYWTPKGSLRSVLQIREGQATEKKAGKVTDVFNFMNDQLVGWIRTEDETEDVVDPADPGFAAAAKRVAEEAAEAADLFIKKSE